MPKSRIARAVNVIAPYARAAGRSAGQYVRNNARVLVPMAVDKAVGAAVRAARRYSGTGTQTTRMKKSSGKNVGPLNARSGKRLNARYKVKRKGTQYKADELGMSLNMELGGTITDPYCVYIGHASCPSQVIRRVVFGAMLKRLLTGIRLMPESLTEPIGNLAATDQVKLYYRKGYGDSAAAINTITTNCVPGGTFAGLLDSFVNNYVLERQADVSANIEWYFTKLEFVPASDQVDLNLVRINLVEADVTFYSNSQLKIQNRTSTGVDDDADDVDNQPLMGKAYYCKGSGTLTRRQTAQAGTKVLNMFGSRRSGLYEEVSNNAGNPVEFREPPKPWHYANVSKHEAIKIEPGVIRKSYLKSKYTMKLSTLMKLLLQNTEKVGLTAEDFTTLGESKFYALEKTIEIVNDGTQPTQLISVAFENNVNVGAFIKTKRSYVTTTEVYTSGSLPN